MPFAKMEALITVWSALLTWRPRTANSAVLEKKSLKKSEVGRWMNKETRTH